MDKVLFSLWLLGMTTASSLVGYDCSQRIANVTTFSLYDDIVCHDIDEAVRSDEVQIQLVKVPDYDYISIYECKIEVWRHVQQFTGGQWFVSHSITPKDGIASYIQVLTRNECFDLHESRRYSKYNINNINVNQTNKFNIQLAGVWVDNTCSPSSYTDQIGSYTNVCVGGTITITLSNYTGKVDIKKNKVYLNGNQPCSLDDLSCHNVDGSQAFWRRHDWAECSESAYDVYYEGRAQRFEIPQHAQGHLRTYVVKGGDHAFSLDTTKETEICGMRAYQTEHPKFKIIEKQDNTWRFIQSSRIEMTIDVFTYLNIKFTTYEKHMKANFEALYRHWKLETCHQAQKEYKHLRALAIMAPESFAYYVTGKPGHTAHTFGELVHVVKCAPVQVTVRSANKCYTDLPVNYTNQEMFLTPFNRILVKKSVVIKCSDTVPAGFKIADKWLSQKKTNININGNALVMQSSTAWKYQDPDQLVTAGIYTLPQLERYNERLITLHTTAVKMETDLPRIVPTLQQVEEHDILLTDPSQILSRYFKKLWAWWEWIATNLSAIVGVYILYRCVCSILGWIINGCTLYKKYGISWKLAQAPSTKLTMYSVLKPAKDKKKKKDKEMITVEKTPTYERPLMANR